MNYCKELIPTLQDEIHELRAQKNHHQCLMLDLSKDIKNLNKQIVSLQDRILKIQSEDSDER